jgi:hypothetical protein
LFAGQDILRHTGSTARARVGTALEVVKHASGRHMFGACTW